MLYIDKGPELARLCDRLAGHDWLVVDTEFIREKTYFPRLCLIQVAVPGVVALIDPLSIDDLTPLRDLLLDGRITKVFHAASQDLEVFFHLWGEVPAPVFDTQMAATLLGHGDQIGYGNLVEAVLGIALPKGHTRSDWAMRPLDAEQIEYAAADVLHLCDLYTSLRAELVRLGRLDWLEEDFAAFADPARYRPDPENAWRRLRSARSLPDRERAVIARLASWREEVAMQSDRPRRWVLADEALSDMARLRPRDIQGLARIRNLNEGVIRRYGERLLALIEEAASAAPPEAEARKTRRPGPEEDALLDAMMALLRLHCASAGISPSMVASRKDIEALAGGETDIPLLQGWRAHIAGDALHAFLAGRVALEVADGYLAACPLISCPERTDSG